MNRQRNKPPGEKHRSNAAKTKHPQKSVTEPETAIADSSGSPAERIAESSYAKTQTGAKPWDRRTFLLTAGLLTPLTGVAAVAAYPAAKEGAIDLCSDVRLLYL